MEYSYKILIIEDEELFSDRIEMLVEKLGHEVFGVVDNSEDALLKLNESRPDLILMDVNIEGEYDGIELTDMIHQQWEIPVIFITSLYDDRTFKRITRTNPVGFILKPFNDIQLKRSIELVIKQLGEKPDSHYEVNTDDSNTQKEEFLFVKKRKQLDKIKIADIFYLEADGRYSQVYTIDKKYLIRLTLRELILKLNSTQFIQTHRSFIVNVNKIKTVDLENNVVILENMHIPISRRERDVVLAKLDWIG